MCSCFICGMQSHASSIALQNENLDLKTCASLYLSLAELLENMRGDFENLETDLLPEVGYKAETKRKVTRKRQLDEASVPETNFSARDNFRVNTFLVIIDTLLEQMHRRDEVYSAISLVS
mgnify:CR=1 FL=1